MTISSAISHPSQVAFERVIAWENLLLAWRKAAHGKRAKPGVAGFESRRVGIAHRVSFEHQVADRLLALQSALRAGTWQPGVT